MQLFKRMGSVAYYLTLYLISNERFHSPRVILVELHGRLVGLITVKDVLRFIAIEQPESPSSWERRASLDDVLNETWTSTSSWIQDLRIWWRRVAR